MYPPNNSHITHYVHSTIWLCRRLRLKCDGTRAEKPEFVFGSKCPSTFKSAGGRQFSRLLEAEVCASAVLMLDTACSKVGWMVLATHCIRCFLPSIQPHVHHCVPSHFNCTLQLSTQIQLRSPHNTNPSTKTLTLYSSQHFLFVSHIYISLLYSPEIVCM